MHHCHTVTYLTPNHKPQSEEPWPSTWWLFFNLSTGRCRVRQTCLLLSSMVQSSAVTPTSCACHGRAGCPRVRRRSRCAGNATMRRAGSLPGTAAELSGSRSLPATADGTGPLHRESTSTSEDTTVRWDRFLWKILTQNGYVCKTFKITLKSLVIVPGLWDALTLESSLQVLRAKFLPLFY